MSARDPLLNIIQRIFVLTLLPLILFGCATTPGKSVGEGKSPASKIYSEGKEALSAGKYDMAISKFSSLEALYPADPYTQQAQMELAYAYHKNGDATSAIATAERFIKNYPTHANVDYAYYLRGLTSFEQAVEQLSSEPAQKTQRRPLMAQLSLQYLSELVELYPDSKYSSDASRRIAFLKDKLAQYEVLLAKHFIEKGDYASAALHAKTAMENYPQAPAIPEAAAVINEAYKMLEIKAPATMAANDAGMDDKSTMEMSSEAAQTPDKKPSVVIPFKAKETRQQNDQQEQTNKAEQMPQQQAASQSNKPDVEAGHDIRQESWFLTQDPGNYTIQLLGTGNERLLVALINRLNITDKAAYYKNTRIGKPWYALTYGSYSSIAEANDAINQLPADLMHGQPWIRKFSDIQALIGER